MGEPHRRQQAGFTLIEVMIVMVIILVLLGLSTISLGKPQASASLSTTVDTLLNDLKSQQLLAMVGDTAGSGSQQAHGIYVQPNDYTLFANSSYNAGDGNNFVVPAPQGVSFSTTLPASQVIFNKGTGAVSGYTAGSDTITIHGTTATTTITIGRFGALSTP